MVNKSQETKAITFMHVLNCWKQNDMHARNWIDTEFYKNILWKLCGLELFDLSSESFQFITETSLTSLTTKVHKPASLSFNDEILTIVKNEKKTNSRTLLETILVFFESVLLM